MGKKKGAKATNDAAALGNPTPSVSVPQVPEENVQPAGTADTGSKAEKKGSENQTPENQESIFTVARQLSSKEIKCLDKGKLRQTLLDKIWENKELRKILISLGLCDPMNRSLEGINVPIANLDEYVQYHDYTMEEFAGQNFHVLRPLLLSVQDDTSALLEVAKARCSGDNLAVMDGRIVRIMSAPADGRFSEEDLELQKGCADMEALAGLTNEKDLEAIIGTLPKGRYEIHKMKKETLEEKYYELTRTVKNLTAVVVSMNQMEAVRRGAYFGQKSEKGRYICPQQGSTPGGGSGAGKGKTVKINPTGGQKRQKYGAVDNNVPRKKPGCVKDNTQKLQTIRVYSGELSPEELMKAFGITDPAELKKVRKVTSRPSETVYVIPESMVKVENYQYTYIYDKKQFTQPRKASEWKILPGSVTSESLLAYVFDQMTFHHQPMNRIAEGLRNMGFEIGRDAYPRWAIRMVTDYLEELYHRLLQLVRGYDHLHIDETFFHVIHDGRKAGSASYMWIFRPSELYTNAMPITFFLFDETRGTDVLRSTLGDWTGKISCDGFIDYKVFEKENAGRILIATCWAHLRRKLAKACKTIGIRSIPVEKRDKIPAFHSLMRIAEIFSIEKGLKDVDPDERRRVRTEKIRPIMEGLFKYFRQVRDNGKPGKETLEAIDYALNMEESLLRCLDDPMVPLTNSHAERGALFFALSRNCFRQIDSLDGAYAQAVLMTIACTAKASGVDGFLYFRYLLEKMPSLVKEHRKATGVLSKCDLGYLDPMLPWSEEYKAYEAEERRLQQEGASRSAACFFEARGYRVEVIPPATPGCDNGSGASTEAGTGDGTKVA